MDYCVFLWCNNQYPSSGTAFGYSIQQCLLWLSYGWEPLPGLYCRAIPGSWTFLAYGCVVIKKQVESPPGCCKKIYYCQCSRGRR
ncbi:unnamed protein product [Citrullus colocynthis]|uniref:Uncharacterized protein n=1 Tax=Citrullus colocynthis TaxID=252529 RepID=A0ABP0YC80_9ROSI